MSMLFKFKSDSIDKGIKEGIAGQRFQKRKLLSLRLSLFLTIVEIVNKMM
jgi:hypothetical protein